MLSKIWKKLGLIILIIACLWNIVSKITKVISYDTEIGIATKILQKDNKEEK